MMIPDTFSIAVNINKLQTPLVFWLFFKSFYVLSRTLEKTLVVLQMLNFSSCVFLSDNCL